MVSRIDSALVPYVIEFIIPHGSTILLPWDHILCLTRDDSLHELTEAWGLSDK